MQDRVELYEIKVVGPNNDPIDFRGERQSGNSTRRSVPESDYISALLTRYCRLELIHTFETGVYQALEVTSSFAVTITSIDQSRRRVLSSVSRTMDVINRKLWKSSHKSKNDPCRTRLTSMLPLELNEVILGYGE